MDAHGRRNRLAGLLLAVLLPALATGCATGGPGRPDGQTSAEPTPPAVTSTPPAPDSGSAAMNGLPLAAYQPGDQDIQQAGQSQTTLVVSCMHKAGFATFSADDYPRATPPDNTSTLPAGAWGYLGAQAAATQGFHPPAQSPVQSPVPGTPPVAPDESEAYVTARVDCDRQVADQLKPVDQSGTDLVNRLSAESLQEADQDSRVTTATSTWAACMTKAGYPTANPDTLAQHYRSIGGPPSTTELATARTDADCTARSGLAGVYFAVLTGYQRQQITQNATALTAHQQVLKDQRQRLAKLLSSSAAG
ncbi:hypothetical protein [Kitasatospora sp. MAP5-34]|uniref:hypothetical protein n=1 Tax=Kitasatospora sp. MAP5-34 TaxID=3035102 RepID=UPI002476BE94|nr:hypothetical protein [Kitasatospora sp. MAP5-34]MDH6576983.1 hypothetical protein [Kitasatospora sp. MAP5-34]